MMELEGGQEERTTESKDGDKEEMSANRTRRGTTRGRRSEERVGSLRRTSYKELKGRDEKRVRGRWRKDGDEAERCRGE